MRIGVPSEHGQIERRVALTPDAVARLLPLGVEVLVQAGAGVAAALPDGDYAEAGARIVPDGAALLAEADLVVMVTRPRPASRRSAWTQSRASPARSRWTRCRRRQRCPATRRC
jgi:alanine dehydrogenase